MIQDWQYYLKEKSQEKKRPLKKKLYLSTMTCPSFIWKISIRPGIHYKFWLYSWCIYIKLCCAIIFNADFNFWKLMNYSCLFWFQKINSNISQKYSLHQFLIHIILSNLKTSLAKVATVSDFRLIRICPRCRTIQYSYDQKLYFS